MHTPTRPSNPGFTAATVFLGTMLSTAVAVLLFGNAQRANAANKQMTP